jgi:hypothetical protein
METIRKAISWKLRFLATWWPILAFLWCILWFIFIFTPVVQGDAYVKSVSPTKFEYVNVSRKPFPSDLICVISSSVTIVESNKGSNFQKNPPTDRWGTGDGNWSTWRVIGLIPFGATNITVHKELTYECFGGVFRKKVSTPSRSLVFDTAKF